MRPQLPVLAILSLAAVASAQLDRAVAAGRPAPVRATTSRADAYVFAFHDAEIAQVVQEVLGQAGVAYSIDPSVTGKLSFRIEQRLTREQLIAALEQVLAANGVALVKDGDQYVVTAQAKARTAAGVRPSARVSSGAGYEVVVVPLAYAQPSEVAKAMEAISPADTVLYANDKLGLLLIGGTGSQLKTALETVRIFDQNTFQDARIRWVELNQGQAATVAADVERLIQSAGLGGVSVVPLRRLNGVIVFGRSPEALDQIARWVTRLDVPGKEVNASLWVYRPRNTSAEALAKTVNSVLGSQTRIEQSTAPSPQAGYSGAAGRPPEPVAATTSATTLGAGEDEVRVGVDKETNTLLIFAAPAKWVQIQRILTEIDLPARQILIEASILEVTLGKEFQFGVDWRSFSKDLTVAAVENQSGKVQPQFPGFSAVFLNNNIQAAVNALGSRTDVEVVSAPKIIALDNRTAHLQVGDQVPIIIQSAQSQQSGNAPLINTVDYRNTGVILTVTPRITGDDHLTLDVAQEVSSVSQNQTSGIDSPTIQQRRFESTLVLRDGGTVALGGLISTNRSVNDSGIPGLRSIPIAGALFKRQDRTSTRTELIVLLSARIIKDNPAADRALADLEADMHELQNRGLLAVKR